MAAWSVASKSSKGPTSIRALFPSLISLATTFSLPYLFLSSKVSSVPIWPHAPMIRTVFCIKGEVNSVWGQIYPFLNFVHSPMRKLLVPFLVLSLLGGCKKSPAPSADLLPKDSLEFQIQRMPEKLQLNPEATTMAQD